MKLYKLSNGLSVIHKMSKTSSVTVQVLVDVGSNNERLPGISHFVEHMVFEGTKFHPSSLDIANQIESLGGDLNAYTSDSRTCYYVKILKKHFSKAVEVLADVLQNPLLRKEDVEKQRHIILKEIGLVTDDPRFHQWILWQKTAYKKHPSRNPTYGNKKSISLITQNQIKSFFNKYYNPNNMVISVVGDVKNVRKVVSTYFVSKKKPIPKKSKFFEPRQIKPVFVKESRKSLNSYLVMGFKAVPRLHKDSYVFDVIDGLLGRGQSGWLFDVIRSKYGLAYDVGSQVTSELDYGFFAVYASASRKNISRIERLARLELDRLQKVSLSDVKESADYIEGTYLLDEEDTQRSADNLLFWHQVKDFKLEGGYLKKIRKVTVKDVKRVAKKYFVKNNCTIAVIEGR